jgi:very-short-patch-repair endonuclease
MAAVLAGGEGAVLSHRSAAALWTLLPVEDGPINITVPTTAGRRRRRGLRIHRAARLTPSVVTRRRGILVTTPSRTLADLRRVSSRGELERAIAKAEFLGLPIERHPDLFHEPTRSVLERDFLRVCRRHRLPRPEVNGLVGPYQVDFLWREQRLVVEVDGYEAHGTRSAFETDRARDVQLKLLGYEVVRFTYWQVKTEAREVARVVRELLRRGMAP